MTKQNEIEILLDAAAKLGNDSYCGTWLKNQIETIETDIRNDFFPSPDYNTCLRKAQEIMDGAKAEAAAILERANQEAQKIRDKALAFCDSVRGEMRDTLRRMEREMDR